MNKELAIEELKRIRGITDTELAHEAADDVLCALLQELGCREVVEEYWKIEKWYA